MQGTCRRDGGVKTCILLSGKTWFQHKEIKFIPSSHGVPVLNFVQIDCLHKVKEPITSHFFIFLSDSIYPMMNFCKKIQFG